MPGPAEFNLVCPDPAKCPVAVDRFAELCRDPAALPVHRSEPDHYMSRVYSHVDGSHAANPGHGNTRFAPFPDEATGGAVPTAYLADGLTAALLETVFHNVASTQPLPGAPSVVVPLRDVLGKAHIEQAAPRALHLVDLRDGSLAALGVQRAEIVSSPAEHYPCTRRVAQRLHGSTAGTGVQPFDGIVWHSRQAAWHGMAPAEVLVVFADRVPMDRRAPWRQRPVAASFGSLLNGSGYQRLLEVADLLGVTIEEL